MQPGIRSSCCHLSIRSKQTKTTSLQWPQSTSMCHSPANSSNTATMAKLCVDEVRHRIWPSASWARRSTLVQWPPTSLLREVVALPETNAMPPKPHLLTVRTGLSPRTEPSALARLLLAGLSQTTNRHHKLGCTATVLAAQLVIQAPRPRAWV